MKGKLLSLLINQSFIIGSLIDANKGTRIMVATDNKNSFSTSG
jgi:hypothetical protein